MPTAKPQRLITGKSRKRLVQQLVRARLWPLSPLARFAWTTLAAAIIMQLFTWVLPEGILHALARLGSVLAYGVAIPCGLWAAGRWVKDALLWRLRNRLVVTYLFIGAAPILLLVSLALISAYFLAGQFAAYLVTSDLHAELMHLSFENRSLAAHIIGEAPKERAELKRVPELAEDSEHSERVTELFDGDSRPFSQVQQAMGRNFTRPGWLKGDFNGIVWDGDRLFYRSAHHFRAGGRDYTIVSSEPLSSESLAKVLQQFGRVDIVQSNAQLTMGDEDVQADSSADANVPVGAGQGEVITAGQLSNPLGRFDQTIHFVSPLPTRDWRTGKEKSTTVLVQTRPSQLYNRLFSTSAKFGRMVRVGLFTVASLFGFIEIFALFIGMRLTRSVTGAVAELYDATQHIERGDLRHRIRVRSNDQLAALEGSFNNMAASLERLLSEQREKERLQSELAIAQQVQEQLFPRAWTSSRYLDLFGVCRPARTVSGDYYDFLPLGPARTGIAVGDISGKGISAALLMATVQSAVRSFEFGRSREALVLAAPGGGEVISPGTAQASYSPATAMEMLNQHLYLSTPPEKYATMFLAVYDGECQRLSYSNAGHLPPILLRSTGEAERLNVSGTVIGLFNHMQWEQEEVSLAPGDLLCTFSDGLTEPENEFGEFGEERVVTLLRQNRHLPLEEIARLLITAVQEWIGDREQPDDITVVLARPS
jgi:phosphoserine phosphatase RsbU/P